MHSTNTGAMPFKVPIVITLCFWIIKILATTVGETGADFLIFKLHFGIPATSLLMGLVLATILYAQIKSKQYIPWLYWMCVVLVSIVGTLITDSLTDIFDVPLTTSTLTFSIVLLVTFRIWYRTEGSLSIHSIDTVRRELFYWTAILFTFALGTAAGDLLAESAGLGYILSALIFGAVIALVTMGFYGFRLNGILAFWLAYIITRPLGASMGDYLTQPVSAGGLDLGTPGTSAVFLLSIIGLVAYLTMTRLDAPDGNEYLAEAD